MEKDEKKIMSIDELLETDFDSEVEDVEGHENLTWILWGPQWIIVTP